MKRIVFGLLFSVVASVAAGQCRLEPAEDIAQSSPSACKTYYDNVFALLFGGFSEKPEARYVSLPFFTEEYAFSLEKDKKDTASSRPLSRPTIGMQHGGRAQRPASAKNTFRKAWPSPCANCSGF